jgi:hypothetical protein
MSPLPRPRRLGKARVLVAALLLAPAALRAAPSQVVLLRSGAGDAVTRRAEARLSAELRAAGFDVTEVDAKPGIDTRTAIETTSTALRPIATLAILPAAPGAAAEVWLSDRVTGKLVIRRVDAPGTADETAADLALRAVELLRGSLLEITVENRPGPTAVTPPPPEVTRFVQEAEPVRPAFALQGLGVALGGAGSYASGGLGPALAPVLRLSYGFASGLQVRASVRGPSSSTEVAATEGTARVGQASAAADLAWVFRPRADLQPYVFAGAAIDRFRVDGTGRSSLFPGRSGTAWIPAPVAGAGAFLRLGRLAALFLEAQAGYAPAPLAVSIAGREALRLDGLAASLSLGVATGF